MASKWRTMWCERNSTLISTSGASFSVIWRFSVKVSSSFEVGSNVLQSVFPTHREKNATTMSGLFSPPTPKVSQCPYLQIVNNDTSHRLDDIFFSLFWSIELWRERETNTIEIAWMNMAWIHFISLSLSLSFQEVFLFAVADHWMKKRGFAKMPTNDKCRVYHWPMTMVNEWKKTAPNSWFTICLFGCVLFCCCCNRIDENLIGPNILFIDRNGKAYLSHCRIQ